MTNQKRNSPYVEALKKNLLETKEEQESLFYPMYSESEKERVREKISRLEKQIEEFENG